MFGVYLHSPQDPCSKDCCSLSPCSNKAEAVSIKGKTLMACVHATMGPTDLNSTKKELFPPKAVGFHQSPARSSHGSDCMRRNLLLPCPFGRCNQKFENIFSHFFNKHDFIRTRLNSSLYYRLKNINKDLFVIYEPQEDVFFVGHIEDSYQTNVCLEMYVIHNYKNSCCGHPKFAVTIPGIAKDVPIEFYKSKYALGNGNRKIRIVKDNLKKSAGSRAFYDLEIIIRRLF